MVYRVHTQVVKKLSDIFSSKMLLQVLFFTLLPNLSLSSAFAQKLVTSKVTDEEVMDRKFLNFEENEAKKAMELTVQEQIDAIVKRQVKAAVQEVERKLKQEMDLEMKTKCRAEVLEQLEKSISNRVLMSNNNDASSTSYGHVCVYKSQWDAANSTVTFDRITSGFIINQPGLAVDTHAGSFTISSSGHYMITFSGYANVHPGDRTEMSIYKNNERVVESEWVTMASEDYVGGYWIDQGSRTLVGWSSFHSHFSSAVQIK